MVGERRGDRSVYEGGWEVGVLGERDGKTMVQAQRQLCLDDPGGGGRAPETSGWRNSSFARCTRHRSWMQGRSCDSFTFRSSSPSLDPRKGKRESSSSWRPTTHPSVSPRVLPLRDSRNRFSNSPLLPSCACCRRHVRTGHAGAWAPPPRTGGAGSRPIPWRRRSSGCARCRVRGRREGSTEVCRYNGGVGEKSVGQRVGGRDFEGQGGGCREEGVQRPTRHKTARTTTRAKSKTAHRMKNQPQNPLPSPAGGLAGSLDVGG